LILLAIQQVAFGRQLECVYQNYDADFWSYWPAFKTCVLNSVDLSASQKSVGHSFSGNSSEKSDVSLVKFYASEVVDFIPTEVTREFPKLNALVIQSSNLPVVKTGLLGRDFKNLELLIFWYTNVQTIEAEAFTELENLKHFRLFGSPLKTLPFGLFRNNLKLEIAFFYKNKISMIHPTLFDGLHHLQYVEFGGNVCVNRRFGICEYCTDSLSEMKSALFTCFANCEANPDCSTSEKTTTPEIEIP
jgi:hypothetical protein